jgi:phage-related tail fiber protein
MAADGTNGTVDLRGEFIRGWDNGRGADAGRALAVWQSDLFRSHYHQVMANSFAGPVGIAMTPNESTGDSNWYSVWDSYSDRSYKYGNPAGSSSSFYADATGGQETRPRNLALLACMKL